MPCTTKNIDQSIINQAASRGEQLAQELVHRAGIRWTAAIELLELLVRVSNDDPDSLEYVRDLLRELPAYRMETQQLIGCPAQCGGDLRCKKCHGAGRIKAKPRLFCQGCRGLGLSSTTNTKCMACDGAGLLYLKGK